MKSNGFGSIGSIGMALALLGTGCSTSGDSSSAATASFCHMDNTNGFCIRYAGAGFTAAAAAAHCQSIAGIADQTMCSPIDLVTICDVPSLDGDTSKSYFVYYYSTGTQNFDLNEAGIDCSQRGGSLPGFPAPGVTDTVRGSCSSLTGAPDQCVEFVDGSIWSESTMQSNCTSLGGSYQSNVSCSATNKMGSCKLADGGPAEQNRVYYSPTYNGTSASQACASGGGTFTPSQIK